MRQNRLLFLSVFIIAVLCILIVILKRNGNETSKEEELQTTTTTEVETTTIEKINFLGDSYEKDITKLDLTQKLNGLSSSDLITGLSSFSNLKEVNLTGSTFTTDEMIQLKESYPDIVFDWSMSLYEQEVNENTEALDLTGVQIEDLAYFEKELSLFDKLNHIDLSDSNLSNENMEQLMADFPNIKFVWKVTLGLWTIKTDTVAFSTLKDGTITYRLTNDDVQVLKYCTDMEALDLGHNKVTDISFLKYMPKLKILILVDNWMGDTAEHYISDLSMLQYCPDLRYLEFFVGDVSDISFLQYLPKLVDLNISYNPISDVSYLLNLPNIERLYLEHTNLTEEDYALLQETYPNAQVVYYGEGSVDQGWREHERYFAMIDMFHNNYVSDLFK